MPWMENVKRGAARAAYEAERLVRLNRAESVAEQLRGAQATAVQQLGTAAFNLFQQDRLPVADLQQYAEAVLDVGERLREKEREIDAIRRETAAADNPASVTYGHMCPRCRIRLDLDASFCPECGGRAADVPRPPSAPSLLRSSPAEPAFDTAGDAIAGDASPAQTLPTGAPLSWQPRVTAAPAPRIDDSQPLPPPADTAAPPLPATAEAQPTVAVLRAFEAPAPMHDDDGSATALRCNRCKAALAEDALFCTECGARVKGRG